MRNISAQSTHNFVFTDVVEAEGLETALLDITDSDAVNRLVDEKNIDFIVNCAAYTNVDKAETDEAFCRLLNAQAPCILAEAMRRVGGLLLHISTDYVFGGEAYNVPCREDQQGTPTGVYGQTKLEGEQAIMGAGCDYVILRTAWLYSEYGRNFVKTMLELTAMRPQLKVVFDQAGTPTYALDLARAIATILEKACALGKDGRRAICGIYHYSNEGVCSWYDFAAAIMQEAGLSCRVLPCTSDEYAAAHPESARRPAWSALENRMLRCTVGDSTRDWRDALKDFFANWNGE